MDMSTVVAQEGMKVGRGLQELTRAVQAQAEAWGMHEAGLPLDALCHRWLGSAAKLVSVDDRCAH